MQVMVPGKKLVQSPIAKETLLGLVHLSVDLVPNEMMQADNHLEDDRSLQGDCGKKRGNRQCLEKALPYTQAQVSILTSSNGLVVKDLAVVPVVKNRVVFKHPVERPKAATQTILLVHQAAMNLMFQK
jgi:hypothetical protein